eukprot:5497233-Alexandrium_andersonii.AAC.1
MACLPMGMQYSGTSSPCGARLLLASPNCVPPAANAPGGSSLYSHERSMHMSGSVAVGHPGRSGLPFRQRQETLCQA